MSKGTWIAANNKLPKTQGRYEFCSVAVKQGVTIYHPRHGVEYDMQCEEACAIAGGIGSQPDKVTHWRKIQTK